MIEEPVVLAVEPFIRSIHSRQQIGSVNYHEVVKQYTVKQSCMHASFCFPLAVLVGCRRRVCTDPQARLVIDIQQASYWSCLLFNDKVDCRFALLSRKCMYSSSFAKMSETC